MGDTMSSQLSFDAGTVIFFACLAAYFAGMFTGALWFWYKDWNKNP